MRGRCPLGSCLRQSPAPAALRAPRFARGAGAARQRRACAARAARVRPVRGAQAPRQRGGGGTPAERQRSGRVAPPWGGGCGRERGQTFGGDMWGVAGGLWGVAGGRRGRGEGEQPQRALRPLGGGAGRSSSSLRGFPPPRNSSVDCAQ